jgi:dimethylargininase
MLIALTRGVSPTLAACELTWLPRQPIDLEKAVAQHHEYEACLRAMGAQVIALPALAEFPDGMFVEDPVFVVDELAVLTRPGAASRRGEGESLVEVLSRYREIRRISEPATLEGGDVMRIGRDVFVGLSTRTNEEGVAQLARELGPFGYRVRGVPVKGCLHLKSACCGLGDGKILANRAWIDAAILDGYQIIDVAEGEPGAANVLRIGETVLMPAAFPRTRERLEREGFSIRTVDISELMKAEAGITCSSLIFAP